ncbi:MAG: potassium-transporting ATPase subunit C [Methylobacter sp.]|nr:MAG: potassium-transporting ATPase subunit C [Methylobacter sp.]
MTTCLKPALVLFMLMTLLTGVIYPLTVSVIAQLAFPFQANGSIVRDGQGQAQGSVLIGQGFISPGYFWSRPSATSPYPYNAAASSGSNLGPSNPALAEAVKQRVAALNGSRPGKVPVDLVTASASGLDPHISPAAAEFQVERVANARNLPVKTVQELVTRHIEPRQLGVLGEPRVNVLLLNRALAGLSGATEGNE